MAPFRLSKAVRATLLVAGLGLLAMLGLARWLRPDASGYGTHRQLGLPPCAFIVLFDTRCPSCGMTTSWAHVVRGQLVAAVRANSGGTILALLAIVSVPYLLITAAAGRWIGRPPSDRTLVVGAAVVILVTLIDWIVRVGG